MLPFLAIGLAVMGVGAAIELSKKKKARAQKVPNVNPETAIVNIANPVPAGGDSDTSQNAPASTDAPPPT